MAHLLGAENLAIEFPTKQVLTGVSLGLNEGERIGIVGRNGDGKSTLLRLLAQEITPDAGRVTVRGGVRIGVLTQTDDFPSHVSVGQAIVGDQPEHVWAANPQIRDVISGLVSDLDWDKPVAELSGGQTRRVSLAALLVGDFDVLMLDEPTNHLDVEAITWLAAHLNRRWPRNGGGLLVVTHDRWFLDEVANQTWEVHDGQVDAFEGGYAAYVLQRVERDRQAAASEAKRQNLMRKELAWLRRGAPARTSKPRFRIEAANALIADVPPIRDTVQLQQMATQRLGKDVVDLLDVQVSYGDHQVLQGIEWRLAPGERTGILGANGAGKSTLLRLITGEQRPTSGRVKHGKTVKVATLGQHATGLDEVAEDRVSDVIGRLRVSYSSGGKEMTPGQMLERLGFTSAQLATPVKDLSGGQKRRLQFLLILLDEPNVLVLDEPSNDLDTDMLAAMEDLLDSWPGTLIVVSHDRYLMERVTDQQYAIFAGQLRHLPGGVEEYVRLRAAEGAPAVPALGSASVKSSPDADPSPSPTVPHGSTLTGADRRNAQKELAATERRLAKLATQIDELQEELARHDSGDYVGLQELSGQLQGLQGEVGELEDRWLELGEMLG